MTGQDGGFRAAAARFRTEVAAALTRARRAASEAKAQSADFRRGTRELAEQAKSGRLRAAEPAPRREDEDFSQHQVLFDLDAEPTDGGRETDVAGRQADPGEEPAPPRIDPPAAENTRPSDEDEDFSQQRILLDATVESYRPDALQDSVFELSDEQKPS